MSLLAPIVDAAVTQITGVILPALLLVMGAITVFIVAVYGVLHLYVRFRGGSRPGFVGYTMGRLFGSLIYENEYQKYKAKRDGHASGRDRQARFKERYERH